MDKRPRPQGLSSQTSYRLRKVRTPPVLSLYGILCVKREVSILLFNKQIGYFFFFSIYFLKKRNNFCVFSDYTNKEWLTTPMNDPATNTELVRQAQLGCKNSLDCLCESVQRRLYVYLFRSTLNDELSRDIAQETLLVMVRILGDLEKPDRFWPWLCGIAMNLLKRHYRRQQQRQTLPILTDPLDTNGSEGLANLVSQEIKQIVIQSITSLKPKHRTVLILRCYEQMNYRDIAHTLQCSEFSARVLFHRAKHALRKHLTQKGLSKEALLSVIILFGKFTGTEQTASAVPITTATLQTGTTAAVAATLFSVKAAAIALVAIAAATACSIQPLHHCFENLWNTNDAAVIAGGLIPVTAEFSDSKIWYYYPEGTGGPVMMCAESLNANKNTICHWLQNNVANYVYQPEHGLLIVQNARLYQPDMSVWRLPCDPPAFIQFLNNIEGDRVPFQDLPTPNQAILAIADLAPGSSVFATDYIYHPQTLAEERFQSNWPVNTRIRDRRDALHQQGWTFFQACGTINHFDVLIQGQIPWVYGQIAAHPWFLTVQDGRTDRRDDASGAQAILCQSQESIHYPAGTFFCGLPRPWFGLHCLDTIRRDAAGFMCPFKTELLEKTYAKVIVVHPQKLYELHYLINLEIDITLTYIIIRIDAG